MIITLSIIIVDFLVLSLNSVPFLPYHCAYLTFLIFRLRFRQQPPNYLMSSEKAEELRVVRGYKYPESIPECVICKRAKPPRYYHCRHCQRCVYRLDHHCNFIGNCVGQYNYKVYVHLLVNGFVHASMVTFIALWNWTQLLSLNGWMGLFWLTLLPGIFAMYQTWRLFNAFSLTVRQNQTLIESYKQVRGPKRSYPDDLEEYFGKQRQKWLIPTFVPSNCCDLLEPTYPLRSCENVKEYTYADEYLYGGDEEDDIFQEKQD